jgi:hypothetical protein
LLGDQAQPGGNLPSLRKGVGLPDRGDHGGSGDRSSTFDWPQPLRGLARLGHLSNLPVMARKPLVQFLQACL